MTVPKVVQRQLEQAEAALAQSMVPANPDLVTNVAQLAAAPTTPTLPATPPAPAAPATAPTPPTENWENRFKTLQGMFNAEVPRLQAREKSLESNLASLQEQLKVLQEAAKKPTAPTRAPVDPKDAEAFGADLIEMVDRRLAHMQQQVASDVNGFVGELEKRLKAVEASIGTVSQRTESTLESQFYATLTQLVPDWKAINVSDEFVAWLEEVDDVYGLPRRAALDSAHKRLDAERVGAVFKKFISTRPAKPSAALANQIAPTTSGGAPEAPAANKPKRVISQKVVNDFYIDVAKGRYAKREQERVALEAEINLAAIEGRIV